MKAIVATPYYEPKIGGLENYARQLNRALSTRKNWQIVVITSNHTGKGTATELIDGMRVYRLGRWFKLSNTPINLFWPMQIRKIIKREQPDAIIAHSPVTSMADAVAVAATGIPFILIYHASTLRKRNAPLVNLVLLAYEAFGQLAMRRATIVAGVSKYVTEQFQPSIHNKSIVLPNSVWEKEITPSTFVRAHDHYLFIGSLDKTHDWKGLDDILQAFANYHASHPNAILTVMGGGNDRPRYERLTKSLGIETAVDFSGPLSGIDKARVIQQASALLIYPTTANDAFPTVMLEAWAARLPVIAAAIGPIPSLITDGINGILVDPNQPDRLTEALEQFSNLSEPTKQAIAEAASKQTARLYTWEQQADALDAEIKKLV